MNTPLLETERLLLRTFDEQDTTDVFYGWESDPVNVASERVLQKLGFTYACDCHYDCGGKEQTEGKTYQLELFQ